jgi:hypothetical protein
MRKANPRHFSECRTLCGSPTMERLLLNRPQGKVLDCELRGLSGFMNEEHLVVGCRDTHSSLQLYVNGKPA